MAYFKSVIINYKRDDGIMIYVNGKEVTPRDANMGNDPITFNSTAANATPEYAWQTVVVPNDVTRIAEFVPGINFAVWRVAQGSPCEGQTLEKAGVRRHTGCSVVAVRRSGHNLPAVTPETVLEIDDTVVVLGPQARLPEAAAMFVQPAVSPRKDGA